MAMISHTRGATVERVGHKGQVRIKGPKGEITINEPGKGEDAQNPENLGRIEKATGLVFGKPVKGKHRAK